MGRSAVRSSTVDGRPLAGSRWRRGHGGCEIGVDEGWPRVFTIGFMRCVLRAFSGPKPATLCIFTNVLNSYRWCGA
jgi:hypothetical protein